MTREQFHQELREIEESVVQMATLVEGQLARAMQALLRRDVRLGMDVIGGDAIVNEMQRSIRSRSISIMARQAPVARDLRELTTVQLVINELERMGDHALGIAKQAERIAAHDLPAAAGDLELMARLDAEQIRNVVRAFVDINVQAARDVCDKDDEIDHLYRQVFSQLIDLMRTDSSQVPVATSLLFVAHDLERIGDRVTNIGEDVIYMVTGEIEELN
jgi:phosphate transport system protein